jgi:predicted regulator of Ras-like GTPase activity (Roadblock/LC7/MglB family)
MATHQQVFEAIMTRLSDVQGSLGAMIVSRDGEVMGSKLDRQFAQDKIAAMGSDMVAMCQRVTSECNFGRPDIVVVEGENGKVAGVNAERDLGYIFLLGKADMNVGMAKVMLAEVVDEFEDKMGGAAASSAKR